MPDLEASSSVVAAIGDELRLLLPIAMADGSLHGRERTLLERYAMARVREAGLSPDQSELAAAVNWALANLPDATQMAPIVARLKLTRPEALAAIWETAQVLSEADGIVTGVETVRLTRLKQLLDQANG